MSAASAGRERLKIRIRGAIQGVGFRPFVHRLANELGLAGWVNNSPQGVSIEVEGVRDALEQFLLRLEREKPPRSFIQGLETSWLDPVGYSGFEIRASDVSGDKTALVLPDIATCPDCLREIFDPNNRRYGYPFTNCTNCGPRFSIITALPYDRTNTSMRTFTMCPQCQAEYDDPTNRRFHAQPNACPVCGPQLELWSPTGEALFSGDTALVAAAYAIRRGDIVAVKGIGGFHLMVAAHAEPAVRRLRERKHREEKPFALMFPSLLNVKAVCQVSPLDERLLRSPEAPIVLLQRATAESKPVQADSDSQRILLSPWPIADAVAPANPYLGVMLPYTPLHHLLMAELGFPVVATSGNLSDEPICTDEREALNRLQGIADVFLVHNRPIVRHVDDSIVRVMLDRELVLRRARGYAPLPIQIDQHPATEAQAPAAAGNHSPTILAVGAHLKNAVALSLGPQTFVSQHIGDLESEPAFIAFRHVIADFETLYASKPGVIAADLHPDYLSTKYAREQTARRFVGVQHHIAHVLSCMGENELEPPVLGVSWDGTGAGLDGSVWGGEFFLITDQKIERVAHLRPFRLPGGDRAIKEPRRVALGLLHELLGDGLLERTDLAAIASFSPSELDLLQTMLSRGLKSPLTSSVGRLFDGIASLANLCQQIRFEGQAAMRLEFAIEDVRTDETYSLPIREQPSPLTVTSGFAAMLAGAGAPPLPAARRLPPVLDWAPLLKAILSDVSAGVSAGTVSARFHNALANAVVAVARRIGQNRVILSGGCFQNRYLTERTVQRLQAAGFRPYWHQRVPPNDGGIALGQIVAAKRWNQ